MGVTIKMVTTKLDVLAALIEGGEYVRIVSDGTDYGIYQEFGHVTASGSHVPAHPFMVPAVEQVKPAFIGGARQILEKMNLSPDRFVEEIARHIETIAKNLAPYKTGNLKNSITVSRKEDFLG